MFAHARSAHFNAVPPVILWRTRHVLVTLLLSRSFSLTPGSFPCMCCCPGTHLLTGLTILLFPADIHHVVGDEAFWWRHPPVWLLRLSPGVDAVAKTTDLPCFLAHIQGKLRKALGLSAPIQDAGLRPPGPWDLVGRRWQVEGCSVTLGSP